MCGFCFSTRRLRANSRQGSPLVLTSGSRQIRTESHDGFWLVLTSGPRQLRTVESEALVLTAKADNSRGPQTQREASAAFTSVSGQKETDKRLAPRGKNWWPWPRFCTCTMCSAQNTGVLSFLALCRVHNCVANRYNHGAMHTGSFTFARLLFSTFSPGFWGFLSSARQSWRFWCIDCLLQEFWRRNLLVATVVYKNARTEVFSCKVNTDNGWKIIHLWEKKVQNN